MLTSALLISLFLYHVQSQETCKNPYVEQRLLYDDVKYASPFYVIALPKTPQTVEMDNICYTYFEKKDEKKFFHIMSITYKNRTNTYYDFSKGDITDKKGIAEATSSSCVYHDYTLKPICNVSVFILYRCFIQGQCTSNIDIGVTPGVDVRVTLAASPQVSPECRTETETSLRDTSSLAGGDYILLPQKLTPKCVTKYDNLESIGSDRALGPISVTSGLTDRFAEPSPSAKPEAPPATQTQSNFFRQGVPPPSAFNPYGRPASAPAGASAPYPAAGNPSNGGYGQTYSYAYATKNSGGYGAPQSLPTPGTSPGGYGAPQSSPTPAQTPATMWSNAPGNPSQWNGQSIQPGAETHYHIWQSAASAAAIKTIATKNPNVYYHIHSWAQPQGCCKCR